MQAIGAATGIQLLADFKLTTYNYLLFGLLLAVMMIKRPEGLFPVESAKAEMHGIGVAAEVTAGSADELAVAEEVSVAEESAQEAPMDGDVVVAEEGLDPGSAAEATLTTDLPPDPIHDGDQPEDRR
jgi:hypothetical protein